LPGCGGGGTVRAGGWLAGRRRVVAVDFALKAYFKAPCGRIRVDRTAIARLIRSSPSKPLGETTKAGLLFLPERSVNGNGTKTTVPLA
jgi:hypothetical protein